MYRFGNFREVTSIAFFFFFHLKVMKSRQQREFICTHTNTLLPLPISEGGKMRHWKF